jgi:peptidyl-prolyl cis-trans isomerase A (cyclophilin A)
MRSTGLLKRTSSTWSISAAFLASLCLGSLALAQARAPGPIAPSPRDGGPPERFVVRLDTTKGPIVIECFRDWSPNGADRFFELVTSGYYNDAAIFRIRPKTWAQFGIAGDPKVAQAWRSRTLPDDPFKQPNVRGTVAFAWAVPNGRTTQVFINLRDNRDTHDKEPFVPFGRVIQGMDVADSLFDEYGEAAGGGIRAGKQDPVFQGGNAYLRKNFPKLDYITAARIVR